MKKLIFVLAVCMALGIAGFASAGTQKGDTTLVGSAGYRNYTTPEYWDIYAQIGIGHFLTDQFQLEATLAGSWDEDSSMYGVLLRPNYHFATQTSFVPYVGVSAGGYFLKGDFDETVFSYGAQIGVKQFFRENAFMQVECNWQRYEVESESEDLLQIVLGFGFEI